MQREKWYEESAVSSRSARESKIYTAFFVVAVIFFVAGGIMLFFTYPFVYNTVTSAGPKLWKTLRIVVWVGFLLALLLIGLLLFKLKNRFNVSYDYVYVEDEIRFTKVFNGKRRKFLATVTMEQILKIGYCDKPSYQDALRGLNGRKPKILTPNKQPQEEKFFLYLVVSTSIERRIYVLECRKEMLEYLVFAAGKTKFERE